MEEFGKNLTLSIIITDTAKLYDFLLDHRPGIYILRFDHLLLLLLVHSQHQILVLNYTRMGQNAVEPHLLKDKLDQVETKGDLGIHQQF